MKKFIENSVVCCFSLKTRIAFRLIAFLTHKKYGKGQNTIKSMSFFNSLFFYYYLNPRQTLSVTVSINVNIHWCVSTLEIMKILLVCLSHMIMHNIVTLTDINQYT